MIASMFLKKKILINVNKLKLSIFRYYVVKNKENVALLAKNKIWIHLVEDY